MAWYILARLLFTAGVAYTAFLLRPVAADPLPNVLFGLGLAGAAVWFEWHLRNLALTNLLGGLLGFSIGLVMAIGIGAALFWADHNDQRVAFLDGFLLLVFPYLGLVLGARHGEWLEPARLMALFRASGPQRRYKILDTSVIIDGRIADLCDTGFLDGTLVLPQFVLKELQLVADSSDSMKRNRGRRGLDILQKIQKMSGVEVMISDADYPEIREVDLKLIELANALKPVVLPGEIMKVFILKEGKEYNQGVAYLDDGTMVVVDNARKMIGKTIDVVVTSVLQTTAGKMIFGRYIDPTLASQASGGSAGAEQEPRRAARQPAASAPGVAPLAAAPPSPGK